jgi:hypothetical protein
MPTFYSDIAPLNLDANARNRIQGNLVTGNVVYATATYTCTGTEAATGDVIDVAVLPVGAVPLPELWRVAHEASLGGSDVTIATIGDAAVADRYSATAVALHSSNAGNAAVVSTVAKSVIPRFTVTKATQRVKAAVTRTNAVTAGKKISFLLAYRLP